ncbi:glycohydrolase toxin TNT-related protein, partial [Mycobacterium heckeshornense]
PAALDGAGSAVITVGEGLGSVISTLTGALSGCSGMAGSDPAGAALGRSYDSAVSKLLEAMASTRNGLCRIGDGVRMSAHNYSVAEAMSDVSGRWDSLPTPPSTGPVTAGSSPSAVGAGTGAPAGWGWVAPYIGMIWPNGDSAKLRVAAAAWNAAGMEFCVGEKFGLAGPLGTVRAQQIPEAEAIANALTDSDRSCAAIKQQCSAIADQLNAYAARIDQVHAAILDLLSRICDPMTGIKEVWDILTDKDEDEIKKIANDIRTIVNQFTSEVDALRQQITAAASEATTVISTMGRYAAKEWDQFLHGTDVGRALNQVGQFGKGFGEEAGGLLKDTWTYGTVRALVDPKGWHQSWEQMVDGMAPLVGLGGEGAPGVGQAWKDLGKAVIHWDEWSKNPAEAAGKTTFDIATLAASGGPLSKAGKGLVDAAKGFRKPPVSEAPRLPYVEPPKPPAIHKLAPPTEPGRPAPADRPPTPPDKPAAPAPGKPGSPPTGASLPHSPTESRAPVTEKPAGEAPRSPVSPDQHPANTPGMPGERVPSTHPQPLEPAAARPPGPQVGNPAEPAMAAAPAAQSAPAGSAPHLPMPESSPPNAHPPTPPHDGGFPSGHGNHQGPADGSSPHRPGEGADSDGSHPPGDGSPTEPGHPHGHDGPHGAQPPGEGAGPHAPGDGTPPEHGTPRDGNGSSVEPHAADAGHAAPAPEPKVPGVDYPYPPSDALAALDHHPGGEVGRLAEGGVPRKLLDGYDPLAGRSPEEFVKEFTVPGTDGEPRWDWEHQAPHNGFAGVPEETNHIPHGLRLDRVGPNGGAFMSPEGTPLAERATPPGLAAQYHVFEGTGRSIPAGRDWTVLHGPAKDAFGQPGGGEQWVVIDNSTKREVSVQELIRARMLREVNWSK